MSRKQLPEIFHAQIMDGEPALCMEVTSDDGELLLAFSIENLITKLAGGDRVEHLDRLCAMAALKFFAQRSVRERAADEKFGCMPAALKEKVKKIIEDYREGLSMMAGAGVQQIADAARANPNEFTDALCNSIHDADRLLRELTQVRSA